MRRVFCHSFALFDGCFATAFHSFATGVLPVFHSFATVFHSFATSVLPQSFTLLRRVFCQSFTLLRRVFCQSFTLLRQPLVLLDRSSAVSTDQKGERLRPQWGAKRAVIGRGEVEGVRIILVLIPPYPSPTPPHSSSLSWPYSPASPISGRAGEEQLLQIDTISRPRSAQGAGGSGGVGVVGGGFSAGGGGTVVAALVALWTAPVAWATLGL